MRRSFNKLCSSAKERSLLEVVSDMRTAPTSSRRTERGGVVAASSSSSSSMNSIKREVPSRTSKVPSSELLGSRDVKLVGGSVLLRLTSSNRLAQKFLFPYLESNQHRGMSSNRQLLRPALIAVCGVVLIGIVTPALCGLQMTLFIVSFSAAGILSWKLVGRIQQQFNVGVLITGICVLYCILAVAQHYNSNSSHSHSHRRSDVKRNRGSEAASESVFAERRNLAAASRAEPFATDAEPSTGSFFFFPSRLDAQERLLFGPRVDSTLWIAVCERGSGSDAMMTSSSSSSTGFDYFHNNLDDGDDDRDGSFLTGSNSRNAGRRLPNLIQSEVASTATAQNFFSQWVGDDSKMSGLIWPTLLAKVLAPPERFSSYATPYSR